MSLNAITTLFEPHSVEDFLQSFYGKSFVYIPGRKGKFSYLLPWTELNDILRHHRLDYPRIRLSRDGKNLPTESFIRYVPSRRGVNIPRIGVPELTGQIRNGATLIVDAIDEIYEPVAELTESLERFLHEHVQVNVYVGWGETNGFDLHWDDHDVFIIQVAGKKDWKVYQQTRLYPLYRDIESNTVPPPEPTWEGTLHDGDILYIPRGWWHMAMPVNEPTLHLTFGVNKRTGLDMLAWLIDQLRSTEAYRMDLPRFASSSEQAEHLSKLKEELIQSWGDDLLPRYFQDHDAKAQPRTRLSLPWAGTPEVLPPTDSFFVEITAPRSMSLQKNNDDTKVTVVANGKQWHFAKPAETILQMLVDERLCHITGLYAASADTLNKETVRAFVGELVLEGLVAITEANKHCE